ncbi:Rv3654c family TadE-like protein [Herbiconiux sp. VKM Ac-1786]|uniref:Rv3654c family TadE-like protein n=1 Tax=Herbiconiux sp. VKM Ac-1786 TaxID=2783824 RepID=UPI00351C1A14
MPGTEDKGEEGGGSVVGLAVVAALAAAVVAFAPFGGALAARQALVGAADAAALAAADTASGRVSGDPCGAAAAVAGALGVIVAGCTVDGGGVAVVTVSTTILGIPLAAEARAGPPPHPESRGSERGRPGRAESGQEETTASTYR